MHHDEIAARYTAAVLAQLKAEISAAGHSQSSFALKIGVHEVVLGRYLKGQRALPILLLGASLAELGLSLEVFMSRAQARYEGR